MRKSKKLQEKLAQVKGEFLNDGYRQTGSLGESCIALKHTNGNRVTLVANDTTIAVIKNGRLVKQYPWNPFPSPSAT